MQWFTYTSGLILMKFCMGAYFGHISKLFSINQKLGVAAVGKNPQIIIF